ncbi:unnamed protein product [Polarella glacialis]|uniref:Uncharacterized protein n=1 Tax=Polarella glacialis TaxID=89957 RepID=A0A813E806_POLGL|nr:unnamed protein product [Polarella glacialis]CAE8648112.1 unnamed protein product [Polarella glacialis]
MLSPRGGEVVRAHRGSISSSNNNNKKFQNAGCLRMRARPGQSSGEAEAPKLTNSNLVYKARPGAPLLQQHPGSSNYQEHQHHHPSISCVTHVIFQRSVALQRRVCNHTTAGSVVQLLSGMLLGISPSHARPSAGTAGASPNKRLV